jgi:hypothetical protein
MTPQELSDIDRQVAEAIGIPVSTPDHIPGDYPHITLYESGGLVYWSEPYCNGEDWLPSRDWNHAMLAAEKAGLFMGDGATIYQRGDKFWAIVFAGSTKLLMDESGPLCVARAILKLKGGK